MATVTRMRILLTGARGQLGRMLQESCPPEWDLYTPDSAVLDISNPAAVALQVAAIQPQVIINCAAFTHVDGAELQPERVIAVNQQGAYHLALAAKQCGAQMVQVSTDYVFGADAPDADMRREGYPETAQPSPCNQYGRSKWQAEQAVLHVLPYALVIRSAWLFSEYGHNFVQAMLNLIGQHDQQTAARSIVADQIGCPTYARDLAVAIVQLIQQQAEGGVYHYAGDSAVSWFELAQAVWVEYQRQADADNMPLNTGMCSPFVPISSAKYRQLHPQSALRPAYSALNSHKISRYGCLPSNWQQALQTVVARYRAKQHPLFIG
ncbi:MAG: dTDP-4-dehydrorhamnose reductase [Plesiomonas sp.]|uniref:dTDP-4-dehydrorhamnose reductase n=1 Tax=Plesiomonas sp. TaxID=2486279 RepID=UPI003F334804